MSKADYVYEIKKYYKFGMNNLFLNLAIKIFLKPFNLGTFENPNMTSYNNPRTIIFRTTMGCYRVIIIFLFQMVKFY